MSWNRRERNLYLILCTVNILQIDSDGVLSGIFSSNVTDTMRGQICMSILVVGNFVFPRIQKNISNAHDRCCSRGHIVAYPSYKPTASWTNSSVSSESKDGRRAVVKSKGLKNIEPARIEGVNNEHHAGPPRSCLLNRQDR
jgi:hypothetical protein